MEEYEQQLMPAAAKEPDRIEVVWDEDKRSHNETKHKISFHEAATVFSDPLATVIDDPDHSFDERRLLILGESKRGQLIVVSYTVRRGKIRIINARKPTPRERTYYEAGR